MSPVRRLGDNDVESELDPNLFLDRPYDLMMQPRISHVDGVRNPFNAGTGLHLTGRVFARQPT